MEIHHTARVDEQGELERHLDSLPQDLIDIIADKVLADQPFSHVRSLCSCERWTDFLLSNQYLLYFDMGQLFLFSFRRREWETVSLDFIQFEGLLLSSCVASDGGLLLLVTECAELFVCNPLTRQYRRLQKPRQGLVEHSLTSVLWSGAVRVRAFTNVIVDMVASSDTGHFKVLLATIDHLTLRRTTLVYDSRKNDWRVVEDSGVGLDFFYGSPRAKYQGDLYVAGYSAFPGTVNVLKYDVEREQWRSAEIAPKSEYSDPQIILKINGTLLIGFLGGDTLSFLEVQDTGTTLTLLPSTFGLPLARVREALVRRTPDGLSDLWLVMYIGGENVVYYVGIVGTPTSRTIHVLVWKHNFVDGSDLSSYWEEWRPLTGSVFPLSEKFHNFKPSFLGTF